VTTGILLQYLQDETVLNRISHIILDEVHERQVELDFLMTILKLRSPSFPDLRIVLMSATLESDLLQTYFERCPILSVVGRTYPVSVHYVDEVNELVRKAQLTSSSRKSSADGAPDKGLDGVSTPDKANSGHQYWSKKQSKHMQRLDSPKSGDITSVANVKQVKYLNNGKTQAGIVTNAGEQKEALRNRVHPPKMQADTVAEVVIRIIQSFLPSDAVGGCCDRKGESILVFLSGIKIINEVNKALRMRNLHSLRAEVFILHSSLDAQQQYQVLKPSTNKSYYWKIILATNIAETSITIDDVTHVIDTGYCKVVKYDAQLQFSCLREQFICRASAKQRCGRAGRVQSVSVYLHSQFFPILTFSFLGSLLEVIFRGVADG
jgi:HrpA-like RNA helicase